MPAVLPIPIIGVVGSRKSGKTTAVEAIVRELTKEGYRVATAKHIHEPNFTIDAKGKDTWRHTQAGAHAVVGISQKELATIRKIDTTKLTLNDITQNIQTNTDIIILEGFRHIIAKDTTIPKIVTAKNKKDIQEATKTIKPILAFTGPIKETDATKLNIPYVNIKTQPKKLTEIIDKRVAPIIQKRRETKETINIVIDEKNIPLNAYVQNVTRNVLLAIINTLKGANITGNENIQITLTSPNP